MLRVGAAHPPVDAGCLYLCAVRRNWPHGRGVARHRGCGPLMEKGSFDLLRVGRRVATEAGCWLCDHLHLDRSVV
eukprot:561374-Rhodomonas_salina.1